MQAKKITRQEVSELRRLSQDEGFGNRQLAEMFGISKTFARSLVMWEPETLEPEVRVMAEAMAATGFSRASIIEALDISQGDADHFTRDRPKRQTTMLTRDIVAVSETMKIRKSPDARAFPEGYVPPKPEKAPKPSKPSSCPRCYSRNAIFEERDMYGHFWYCICCGYERSL